MSFGLEHIEKEREVHRLDYYDTLTGLPNRRLFQETAAPLTEPAGRRPGKLVVMVITVRASNSVTASLGRTAADALLRLGARRLRENLAPADTLGRIGGDQFGLILADMAHDTQIGAAVARIFAALAAPFDWNGQSIRLLMKGGASVFPTATDGATGDALLTNAEAALKRAKASVEPWLFYAPHLNAAFANRIVLENALSRALEADQFTLLYQPKVDLRTGKTRSLEALLRWNHPENGVTLPAGFIPVLEDTGMILSVGAWVLQQAMRDLAMLRAHGFDSVRIAVNVSPLQFRQKDFPGYLAAAIGGEARGLDIEITESVMMEDIDACIAVLWKLREMGIGVGLDDFGTGFSSLRYVARLPATPLKIDKSFVDEMPANQGRLAIVSAVISPAHAVDMTVAAVGVGQAEQARLP